MLKIFIEKKEFKFWTEATLERAIDGIDTLSFILPFEPDAQGFKETFAPLSFKKVSATYNDTAVFTGYMNSVTPSFDADSSTLQVDCYSNAGVLNDCTVPPSLLSAEYSGRSLLNIAQIMCKPFGISVSNKTKINTAFDEVAAEPEEKIFSFLTKLAQQQNLILHSTADGGLEILQSGAVATPALVLREGQPPFTELKPQFNSQGYYSEITGIVAADADSDGARYKIKNRFLSTLRPLIFKADDIENTSLTEAVKAKMGRMFADAISYSFTLPTWVGKSGALLKPGDTVRVNSPRAMIYKDYDFVIKSISNSVTIDTEESSVTLMLPGGFEGKIPARLPWGS